MPVSYETLNQELHELLRSRGYDPIGLDSKGDPTDDVGEADVFRFTVPDENDNKINAWATVEGNDLVLYIDDTFVKHKDFEPFTKFLKRWSQRKLLGFNVSNKDRLLGDMKKRTIMNKKEQVLEGYFAMGKKASYSDNVPQVKIILQHTRQLEEGEQRFRNIAKIFVENTNGERFLLPTNRPGLARVYARHIAEGGTPYDDKGRHITSLCEEYTQMAGFVRATRNGQFNESALKLVNEGLNHYNNLRMTLQGMASHRGYNKYFESYTPVLNEETDDDVSLNELFVQETLDPRIESVMPILKRLSKNINEMSAVKELDEWAKSITEVEDETTKTLAEPAEKMLEDDIDGAVADADKEASKIQEAPGAETLAHDDETEKSNLKAFDLGEEDERGDPKSHQAQTTLKHLKKASYGDRADAANIQSGIKGFRDRIDMLQRAEREGNLKDELEEEAIEEKFDFAKKIAKHNEKKKETDEKIKQHHKDQKEKPVEEDLDANQKRAGQLGPTEKVKNNNIGKLVGANEGKDFADILRLAGI